MAKAKCGIGKLSLGDGLRPSIVEGIILWKGHDVGLSTDRPGECPHKMRLRRKQTMAAAMTIVQSAMRDTWMYRGAATPLSAWISDTAEYSALSEMSESDTDFSLADLEM